METETAKSHKQVKDVYSEDGIQVFFKWVY